MAETAETLFETVIGRCSLAWTAGAATRLRLPGRGSGEAIAETADLPAWVDRAITAIRHSLAGEAADLDWIPLDWASVGVFDARVYAATRRIPRGATSTYGAIAASIGDPGLARAVGQALGRNPWPIIIPCHRVTGADGRMGGFSAPGGRDTKRRLLALEGALAPERLPLFGALAQPASGLR